MLQAINDVGVDHKQPVLCTCGIHAVLADGLNASAAAALLLLSCASHKANQQTARLYSGHKYLIQVWLLHYNALAASWNRGVDRTEPCSRVLCCCCCCQGTHCSTMLCPSEFVSLMSQGSSGRRLASQAAPKLFCMGLHASTPAWQQSHTPQQLLIRTRTTPKHEDMSPCCTLLVPVCANVKVHHISPWQSTSEQSSNHWQLAGWLLPPVCTGN